VLTERQREILAYIESQDPPPTVREIAEHFQNSIGTIAQHLYALREKGFLAQPEERQARGLKLKKSFREHQSPVVHIPLYGSIPAGFADQRHQEAEGCISIDAKTLGFKPTRGTFALKVTGDSMIDKHIMDGDVAILETKEPKPGDVVAALIDSESTLKVLVKERGKAFLRAANPKYKDLIPASELVIQGVLVGLVRRCQT
jgi:repressor LexA